MEKKTYIGNVSKQINVDTLAKSINNYRKFFKNY